MEYVYLVASLPALELTTAPRITSAELLASSAGRPAAGSLGGSPRDLEDRPHDVRAPELAPYLDADTQLRNARGPSARGARRRRVRRAALHPADGFDARCAAVAARAMELDDPLERELVLDRLRWTLLDELAVSAGRSASRRCFAYGLKLRLVEKWAAMRARQRGPPTSRRAGRSRGNPRGERPVSARTGRVMGVNGNLVTVEFDESVSQNEVAYVSSATCA